MLLCAADRHLVRTVHADDKSIVAFAANAMHSRFGFDHAVTIAFHNLLVSHAVRSGADFLHVVLPSTKNIALVFDPAIQWPMSEEDRVLHEFSKGVDGARVAVFRFSA